ncbi:MAG: hypothetical protein EOS41_31230 [Mesorhizobium sp.]|uniref:hypothetical protein n=1 Tax=Mesorhizobium sp. TaxID=1871066 RepID=UPI000FE95F00|nr:hypothetical protein [Mesorhizobium sp.]RWE18834.1 MAG: hypothetical protein EOS41_31230 [Mesorhizobium sp.]
MARAKKGPDRHVIAQGLVETREAGFDRPVFRRPGFGVLSAHIRARRERRGPTCETLALMLGLSTQVFRRYEVAFSKMHVRHPLVF